MSQGVYYVIGGKCPGGKCPWGKCPGGTCPGGLCPSGEPVPTQQCIWKCAPRSADCNAPNLYEIICKFMSNVFIIISFISTERSDIIHFSI